MAGSRMGGQGVGFGDDVEHLGGDAWRRISSPCHLPTVMQGQVGGGARVVREGKAGTWRLARLDQVIFF